MKARLVRHTAIKQVVRGTFRSKALRIKWSLSASAQSTAVDQTSRLEIDLGSLFRNSTAGGQLDRVIRERKGDGAHFATARDGKQIASVTAWIGRGRDRKARRISLTTPQGLFLYHLPFPTAEPLSVSEIMRKAGVGDEHQGEIIDLVGVLQEYGVIEVGEV